MAWAAFLIFSILAGLIVERNLAFSNNFWVRLAFAIIIGALLCTWLTFTLSYLIGFNLKAIVLSVAAIGVFVLNYQNRLTFKGAAFGIAPAHAVAMVLVMPLFVFGLREANDGGMSYLGNNCDMSYHMSMVSSFVNNMAFPPLNPQCATEALRYHYLVNFHSSILHMGGLSLYLSVVIPQVLYSFALATLLYHFYMTIVEKEGAALLSTLFFVGGHTGCFNILFAAAGSPAPGTVFHILSWVAVKEQMLYYFMNFLDILINYFQPQRPFLFGFPMSLIILSSAYDTLVRQSEIDLQKLFIAAVFTGLLPLFHVHSFLVIAPVLCLSAFYICAERKMALTALLPVLVGVTQILMLMSGQRSAYYSGFDVHRLGGGLTQMSVLNSAIIARVLFWIRAAGTPLIFGTAAACYYFKKNRDFSYISGSKNIFLMVFIIINVIFFITINVYRFTPNWGDSNKFFLYLTLCLSIFMGSVTWHFFTKRGVAAKAAVVGLVLFCGVAPLLVETYTVFSRQPVELFSACDKKVADWIKVNTAADAVFLTSNSVVHFIAPLTGRAVVDGAYNWETGYDKPDRRENIKKIFTTGGHDLIMKYNIDYIVLSRYERGAFTIKEDALTRFKTVYDETCQGENYRIYKTK
ncbi:MAG: hypothetical protein L7F77_09290 [Candidatus Magnetominusculus sp. LBB02]|nr:hypothetical protein [Candidatus Magnetominusculus sp. LBB02]